MTQVITFLAFVVIWGYCAVTQTAEKRQTKEILEKKIEECSMKGEDEAANFYIDRLTHLR